MGNKKSDYDVFISYAQSRRKLTASLAKHLEAAGFSTWWDTDVLAGQDFLAEIEKQLDACKAAIIIWTPESIKSAWVRSEAGHALRLEKLINTHDRGVKPGQIPKPFDQFRSVRLTDRAAIVEAVKQRIEAGEDWAATETRHEAATTAKRISTGHSTRSRKSSRRAGQDDGTARVVRAAQPAMLVSMPDVTPRPSRRWLIGGVLAALLLAAGLAAVAFKDQFAGPPAPQWTFDNKPFFLGQAIPLAWSYQQASPATSVCFEIVSALDAQFQSGSRTETCTDAEHYFAGNINGARYWKLRAVDSRTDDPLSAWSDAIKVTQFDSVYERIKATGEVDIYASRSQDQDVFKFVKNKGIQGVDFKLSQLILGELSTRLDRKLKADWKSVAWEELLPKAGEGVADYVISSITKTRERERKYRIAFSDSYFCTTHALIYRAGMPVGAIRDTIAGRKVGVQRRTTNARLAEALAEGGLFEVVAFPNTESMENALLGSRIDFGITDTSFARAAQLDTRLGNGMNRLELKEFMRDDMPDTMKGAYKQEYAIAVRAGELELLSTINNVVARVKQDGTLARAFKEAAEEYEEAFGLPPGSRRLSERPWECLSQTAGGG